MAFWKEGMESQLIQGDMKRDREGERKDKLQVKPITQEKDQKMTGNSKKRKGREAGAHLLGADGLIGTQVKVFFIVLLRKAIVILRRCIV